MPRVLLPGLRVRAKVRTMGGWKGEGVIVKAVGGLVDIIKDSGGEATMCDHELAVVRNHRTTEPPA